MRFLVVGGAGYIGSQFVRDMSGCGHEVIVLDNLSAGHRNAIPNTVRLIEDDISAPQNLGAILSEFLPDVVLHYAALALVGESVSHPDRYYRNNVEGMKRLLDSIKGNSPRSGLIFSSTCAVFGATDSPRISEATPKNPISPYGRTKLACEYMIEDYARAYGIKACVMRYFNACGADPAGGHGEDHQPESHLIPNILKAAQQDQKVSIFGGDFDTPDGTCIRDYIHVSDLSSAHQLAATLLTTKADPGYFEAFHIGSGSGFSNLQVINEARSVTGKEIAFEITARREGDPAALICDPSKINNELGFIPSRSNLTAVISDAWSWHCAHPNGYRS